MGSEYPRDVMIKAARSTLNKLMRSASSKSIMKVREIYNIKASDLRQHTQLFLAKGMEMEAKFVIRGRKLRLIHFMPSPRYESVFGQSKGLGRIKRPRQGISVLIRKDTGRKVVMGSFYGRSRGSSKIFIWKRVGEQRFPIKPLFTVSPANMMEKEGEAVFQKLIHDDAGTVFNHELDFYLGKTNG